MVHPQLGTMEAMQCPEQWLNTINYKEIHLMNKVISMNNIDKTLVVRLFGRFRSRYGQPMDTTRAVQESDWDFIIDDWFMELSKFSLSAVRNATEEIFSIYKKIILLHCLNSWNYA